MALFIFVALAVSAVTAIVWGTAALAVRQPQQEHLALEEAVPENSTWSIAPDHLRMW
jgi:hypothetical protein